MSLSRFSLVLFTGVIFSIPVFAQQQNAVTATQPGKLSGQIVDGRNKPVPYATITLLKKTDSTVVNGDLTAEDGSFIIAPTVLGDFIIRVNIIGFKVRYVDNIKLTSEAPEKRLGRLTINASAQSLKEVEVTGEKSMMELSADKKVFNVDKNITAAGGSATDVLKSVPSLAVDVDGDILLRGKETTLLIDGKPATLFGGDVASALQSLPASGIQSVEVITNPSAKFDAQGMAGIINIITKKDNKIGFNGSVSAGAGTGNKYNGSLNLNLRNGKWNVFFNTNYRNNHNHQRTSNERRTVEGILTGASYEDNIRIHGGWFNTLGAEYTIDDKNAILLTQNLNRMQWGGSGDTRYELIDSSQVRSSENSGGPLSSSTSLDLKHKFLKPKQELNANITYAKTWVERSQEYTTRYYDGSGVLQPRRMMQSAPGRGTSASLNAQADFTTPFISKDGRLDAGWKSQLYWFESNNNAQVKYYDTLDFQPDPILQNDYDYTQQVHAAYISFSDQKGKFGYQAGLRAEYSSYKGSSSLVPEVAGGYSNEFFSLFPSAYLSYKLPRDQAIYLSYTRRTNRPSFFQMMPYIDVSNPMDTSAGNPDLRPEFIHNSELNYSRQFAKGHTIIASAYYQYTENLIDRVRRFDTTTGASFSQPRNLRNGRTYGLELTGKAQILPFWDATINFNFFENEIHGDSTTANLSNNGSSWFTKLNSNLRLPAGFSLQLSGSYEAPKVASQGRVLEAYWLDIALRKNLWNNKANIIFNISDIFNTRKYTNLYEFPGSVQTIYRDRETRVGNISFTYRFGSSDVKANSKKRAQENGPAQPKERDNIKQGDDSQGF